MNKSATEQLRERRGPESVVDALSQLRHELARAVGNNLRSLVLYGSLARVGEPVPRDDGAIIAAAAVAFDLDTGAMNSAIAFRSDYDDANADLDELYDRLMRTIDSAASIADKMEDSQ